MEVFGLKGRSITAQGKAYSPPPWVTCPPKNFCRPERVKQNQDSMNEKIILRLLYTENQPSDSWTMFSTSEEEVKELFVSSGQITVGDDFLKIENYPFEPSIAFRQTIFRPDQIDDIDFKFCPPVIRINGELIFLTAEKKSELERFAKKNNVRMVERQEIWGWILEPFLDTKFTPERDQKVTQVLEGYGLTADKVKSLRAEVEIQMLKYNFDTMLWEWCDLGIYDVLCAMRSKYNKDEFRDFYQRAMTIALLTKK
ncbi:MAG: hypothetical protein FWC50_11595 [Planctomycetaceae bacterium]|nr:hypothetical protein [Planctomycetaceae bacterium]